MRAIRLIANICFLTTLLSLTPSLFTVSLSKPLIQVLHVRAQGVSSVAYNVPQYYGADPTASLANRGLYGHSVESAAETQRFQSQLLQALGVQSGVQLVDQQAFARLSPQQLQEQIQKQNDIIQQLTAQAQAAQQQQLLQHQQQSQQQQQPQQQQQQQLQQMPYVAPNMNQWNPTTTFGGVNNAAAPSQQQQQVQQPYQAQLNQNNIAMNQQQPFQQPMNQMPFQSQQQQQPQQQAQPFMPPQQMMQPQQQFQQLQQQQQQAQPMQFPFMNNVATGASVPLNNINNMNNAPFAPPRMSTSSSTTSAANSIRPTIPSSTVTTPSITSLSTPPKPRPASCTDSDYRCQFYRSCYPCYDNHSLPYCGSCLALLNCNDDQACQMIKAQSVCKELDKAKEPQSQGCKQLMAMNK